MIAAALQRARQDKVRHAMFLNRFGRVQQTAVLACTHDGDGDAMTRTDRLYPSAAAAAAAAAAVG